jgi:hypothetical protein
VVTGPGSTVFPSGLVLVIDVVCCSGPDETVPAGRVLPCELAVGKPAVSLVAEEGVPEDTVLPTELGIVVVCEGYETVADTDDTALSVGSITNVVCERLLKL